jgi:transcription antitermination factor NusA-like protein
MGRKKKSVVEGHNPGKRKAANRRKAKRSPISEMYREQEEARPVVRSKQARKTSAKKSKRSGGAVKKRGKRVQAVKNPTRRSA